MSDANYPDGVTGQDIDAQWENRDEVDSLLERINDLEAQVDFLKDEQYVLRDEVMELEQKLARKEAGE